jgi:hypothetical protein
MMRGRQRTRYPSVAVRYPALPERVWSTIHQCKIAPTVQYRTDGCHFFRGRLLKFGNRVLSHRLRSRKDGIVL